MIYTTHREAAAFEKCFGNRGFSVSGVFMKKIFYALTNEKKFGMINRIIRNIR